jgi:hypothetical protein
MSSFSVTTIAASMVDIKARLRKKIYPSSGKSLHDVTLVLFLSMWHSG